MRDITAGAQSALQDRVVRPVLIVRLDILNDPFRAWTGPGTFAPTGSSDSALNDQTFQSVDVPTEVSDITEDQGTGEPLRLSASAHSAAAPLLRQIVRDKRMWRGRKAWAWLGLLEENQLSVVDDPIRIKTGFMTSMLLTRNDETVDIQVTIDLDMSNANAPPFRILDHSRTYPSDTFSAFMIKLANKPEGLGLSDVRKVVGSPNVGPGGRFNIDLSGLPPR